MTVRQPLLILMLGLAVALPARAERTKLTVRFVLAEPIYRSSFTEQQIVELEAGVAAQLVTRLSREIGFLEPLAGGTTEYQLTFRLGDDDASPSVFHAVPLHVELSGPEVSERRAYPFRDEQGWGRPGALSAFRTEILGKLCRLRFNDLVRDLFRYIPVGSGGLLRHNAASQIEWVLGVGKADLCLEAPSELLLHTTLTDPEGSQALRYRARTVGELSSGSPELVGRLRCTALGPSQEEGDSLDLLAGVEPDAVHVDRIFVTRYFPMLSGCRGALDGTSPEAPPPVVGDCR